MKLIENIYTQIKPLLSKVPSGHLGKAVLILLSLQMVAQAEVYHPCGVLVVSWDPLPCSSSGLRELPRAGRAGGDGAIRCARERPAPC